MKHRKRALQRLLLKVFGKKAREDNRGPKKAEKGGLTKRLAKTHREAAVKLTDWSVINSYEYKNAKVKKNHANCEEKLIEFYDHFQKALEKRGIPMYPFEFYRSPERQARLKKQGVTKAGPGSSPHQWGCAVDMVHFGRYWDLTRKEWDLIGAIGKEVARRRNIKIVWGGDWSFYDPAHWELEEWRDIRLSKQLLDATPQ